MTRAKKILYSGYLALGFLALRLTYAFLFAGLNGQQVLIELPSIRLPGPFSHVQLLGPVSADGILRNLELALPFALSILIFGIAASFITPSGLRAFGQKLPLLRNFINAIAIGLSSLPALFDAGRKVFEARALRGEKRSRMLVPILERGVELANSIGLKLALEPEEPRTIGKLSVEAVEVADCKLGPINLELSSGDLVVVSGATGSGKSTLLEAIALVLSEYRGRATSGRVLFDGLEAQSISKVSSALRYIPQNPRELLWGFKVSDLLNSVSQESIVALGLSELAGRSTQDLSEGEALKLLLAENLAMEPSVLLLDEPYAPLDASSRDQLTALLNGLAGKGMVIVLVEHEPEHTTGLNAKHLQLVNGKLLDGQYQAESPSIQRTQVVVGSELAVSALLADVGFGTTLIHAPQLTLHQGERVWLSGDNGSGKTSLLKALAKGEGVKIFGLRPSAATDIALVPENFDDFFVTDSLSAELERADRLAGESTGFTKLTLESILPSVDIDSWLHVHPRDLSRGTRLALAIAMQLSHKPQVLLVDEPFRGLDLRARELMVESLRCVAETGCAVLFASHESRWSQALASRKLVIASQQLLESTEVMS
jgi:energy-coupling factor transport system ATP-binding protein